MNSKDQSKNSVHPLEAMSKRLNQWLRDSGLTVIEPTGELDGDEVTMTFPPNSRKMNSRSKNDTSSEQSSTSRQQDPMADARQAVEDQIMELASVDQQKSPESTSPEEDKKLSIYESNKLIEHIIQKTDLARNYIQSLDNDEAKIFQEVVKGKLDEEKKRYLCESGFLDGVYDEIKNNSIVVKEILKDTGNDAGPFPTGVCEYKGIYWIYSLECDDEEFFLSLADAEDASFWYYGVVL